MYQVTIETHFSAAHHLRNYKGLCENLHGHNWKVEVTVGSAQLDHAGMVIDFSRLKQITDSIVSLLDHQYLNHLDPFKHLNPSSENIASYIFEQLSRALEETPAKLVSVSVWESDKARATVMS